MSIINNWLHSWHKWIIESEDGFTKSQNIMLGGRKGPRWEQRWSTDTREVLWLNPRSQPTHLNILVSWVLNSYGTKICYAGQTKLCLQNNFVAEDNSNYMKYNYDVKLLQCLNKIIKDSFTHKRGAHWKFPWWSLVDLKSKSINFGTVCQNLWVGFKIKIYKFWHCVAYNFMIHDAFRGQVWQLGTMVLSPLPP